jgi:hypothetical protein
VRAVLKLIPGVTGTGGDLAVRGLGGEREVERCCPHTAVLGSRDSVVLSGERVISSPSSSVSCNRHNGSASNLIAFLSALILEQTCLHSAPALNRYTNCIYTKIWQGRTALHDCL